MDKFLNNIETYRVLLQYEENLVTNILNLTHVSSVTFNK